MRLAIISDIHANLEALQATLNNIDTDRADRIVCLGDIVGYNANPLECVNKIRNSGALCVAGNHDRAVCGQITTEEFSYAATPALAWTRSRLDNEALDFLAALPLTRCVESHLIAVHGALHPRVGQELVRLDTEERRQSSFNALLHHPSAAPICAFGHTHRLGIYEYRDEAVHSHKTDEVMLRDGSVYLINPGSVGQSRTSERRATYLVLDTDRRTISVRRVDYDARAAFAKTRAAGLLPRSHLLPASVRKAMKWGAQAIGVYDLLRRPVTVGRFRTKD
jgi:predicted phosphodiesterase